MQTRNELETREEWRYTAQSTERKYIARHSYNSKWQRDEITSPVAPWNITMIPIAAAAACKSQSREFEMSSSSSLPRCLLSVCVHACTNEQCKKTTNVVTHRSEVNKAMTGKCEVRGIYVGWSKKKSRNAFFHCMNYYIKKINTWPTSVIERVEWNLAV